MGILPLKSRHWEAECCWLRLIKVWDRHLNICVRELRLWGILAIKFYWLEKYLKLKTCHKKLQESVLVRFLNNLNKHGSRFRICNWLEIFFFSLSLSLSFSLSLSHLNSLPLTPTIYFTHTCTPFFSHSLSLTFANSLSLFRLNIINFWAKASKMVSVGRATLNEAAKIMQSIFFFYRREKTFAKVLWFVVSDAFIKNIKNECKWGVLVVLCSSTT